MANDPRPKAPVREQGTRRAVLQPAWADPGGLAWFGHFLGPLIFMLVRICRPSWCALDFPAFSLDNRRVARVGLEHLTKVFCGPKGEQVLAADDISLTIEDHESFVLVGPSACGKTTTLRLIAGLEDPTSGAITFDGQAVNTRAPKDRGVAMVFQQPALYPHLSVYENLAFGLRLRRCPKPEADRRVREVAGLLGLTGVLDRQPMALSGGERQRVAVGRAIVRRPKVFLFDEPLSNLDPPAQARLRAELSRLHHRLGSTVIYATHDQAEAMTLGDRVAVMNEGRIVQVDEPLNLYRHPANLFVAGFVGSPPMNLFRGTVVARGDSLFLLAETGCSLERADPLTLRLDDDMAARLAGCAAKSVVLGLRPEHLHVSDSDVTPERTVEAAIESVQPMGPETYLHLAGAGHSFVARVPPAARAERGQKVMVVLDLRYAHIFDAVTQKAIT
jgi:multiple sugar transport system ATP-binding protein